MLAAVASWSSVACSCVCTIAECSLFEAELQRQQEELRAQRMSQVGRESLSVHVK
jgi:hypothetical protein